MKSSRKMKLLLGLAGMCLTAGLLGAAEVNGSFTLPLQAHWGLAVLPAGHYTFSLDHATVNGRILVRRGNEGVAVILAQALSPTDSSGASSMLIVGNRVSSLHLAPIGLTYKYAIPKDQRREMLTERFGVPGISVAITTK